MIDRSRSQCETSKVVLRSEYPEQSRRSENAIARVNEGDTLRLEKQGARLAQTHMPCAILIRNLLI